MRSYEIVVVLKSSLGEQVRKKLVDTIKSWLKESTVVKEENWGQKILSYPIKKQTSGYYVFMTLESNTGLPADFEKKLLGNEQVLRHLVVRRK